MKISQIWVRVGWKIYLILTFKLRNKKYRNFYINSIIIKNEEEEKNNIIYKN